MRFAVCGILGALLSGCAVNTNVSPVQQLVGLRTADLRVHTIFDRLARANSDYCEAHKADFGVILHALGQYEGKYRSLAVRTYGFKTRLGVEAVVPGGPAAEAGLKQGDSIVSVAGHPLPDVTGVDLVSAVNRQLDAAQSEIDLVVVRGGAKQVVDMSPVRACAGEIDLDVDGSRDAGTDGSTVQLTSGLLNMIPNDDQLAAVIAHEFAHVVLNHPERLDRAGVSHGIFAGLGANGSAIRETERQADILSIFLMGNAGYRTVAAADFWEGPGRKLGGFLSDGTHDGWKERASLLRKMSTRYQSEPKAPIWMQLLNDRDKPLEINGKARDGA
ncbi:M48 family metallopeptidase [Stakelama marina]|uniref:M48 family metalloprotease n=1 Tax=Stakelama marina TaxID=2826939 RepID=A0A8T4IG95_9SPHN|nr:M48 family metallopeptidase [Stakelama marina]MBR0552095.1 M48 family metalloprotease [Stakelama marina]